MEGIAVTLFTVHYRHICTITFGAGGGVLPVESTGPFFLFRLEGVCCDFSWDEVLVVDVEGRIPTSLSLPEPVVTIDKQPPVSHIARVQTCLMFRQLSIQKFRQLITFNL